MNKNNELLGTITHPFTFTWNDKKNNELLGTITHPFTFTWNDNTKTNEK